MSKYTNIILSNHEQYLEVLRALEEKTEYVEMDFIDPSVSRIRYELLQNSDGELDFSEYSGVNDEDRNNEVINFAFENLEFIKKEYSDRWSGAFRYVFKADRVFFEFLRKFESFFFNEPYYDENGEVCFKVKGSSLGIDAFYFFDKRHEEVFKAINYTGEVEVRNDLDLDRNIIETIESRFLDLNLTSNEEYLELLRALEDRCEYIELVQVDGYDEDDQVVNFARENLTLIKEEEVEEWWNDSVVPNEKIMEIIERAKFLGKDEKYILLIRMVSLYFGL